MKKILKRFLEILPFKQTMFTVFRNLFHPSEKIYRHLYFKGVFKVKIDKEHSFKINHYGYQLENEVFWQGLTGNWEKESMRIWINLCKKSEIIFDIGANTGIYSLVAQSINPAAEVYAFEPLNTIYKKLVSNVSLNKFPVKSFELALSDIDGRMAIHKVNSDHTYEATLNKRFENFLPDAQAISVDVLSLKTFVEKNRIKQIDLMKIDVETHEPEVLKGFGEYLYQFKPSILIELILPEIAESVNELVKNTDYIFFNIDEKKGIRKVDKIEMSDSYNYLFCTYEKAKLFQLI